MLNCRLVSFGCAFAIFGSFAASATAQLDKLKEIFGGGKINIPGLDKIPGLSGGVASLLNEDALTTNLKDASNGLPFLDGFTPKRFVTLKALKQSPSGSFVMNPGAYAGVVRSYCLHPGTYEPIKGNGYLNAPLKGKRAQIINKLLHVDTSEPGAPTQQQMQSLIWAILARGKYSSFSSDLRNVGDRYLSPEERFELDGGAIGLIPDDIKQKLFGKLDQALQPLVDAQNQLRGFSTQLNIPFDQLEKFAVLTGEPPRHKDDRDVPAGRWMLQKTGIFVRYAPMGYPRTRVDTYVPEKFVVTADATGRITKIEGPKQTVAEISYGEGSLTTNSKEFQGHPIASIKFSGTSPLDLAPAGWTYVGQVSRKGNITEAPGFVSAQVRLEQARLRQTQLDDLKKQYPRDKRTQGDWPQPIRACNVLHLRDALTSALWAGGKNKDGEALQDFLTRASMAELSNWITNREPKPAILFASILPLHFTFSCEVGFSEDEAKPEFDPSTEVAMPARTYSQRIGMSATIVDEQTFAAGIKPDEEDPTKLEDIPNIMRKLGLTTSATLLSRWFSGNAQTASPLAGEPYDFSLTVVPDAVPFELALATTAGKDAYSDLVNPQSRLWKGSDKVADVIFKKYRAQLEKLKSMPNGSKLEFGGIDEPAMAGSIKKYLDQSVQFSRVGMTTSVVKERGIFNDTNGSLGSYNFYAIPHGVASYDKNTKQYSIQVVSVFIFILDSFDFSGMELTIRSPNFGIESVPSFSFTTHVPMLFGWWRKPNKFSALTPGLGDEWSGSVHANDWAFQDYRKSQIKGGDFLVLCLSRKRVLFSPPFIFKIKG